MRAAYSPSDLLVGNLILLLTCGAVEMPHKSPEAAWQSWDTAGDGVRPQHQLLSQQVPRKAGGSCERYSGETGALQLSGLLLSSLQGYRFGPTPIFSVPMRCLREHDEGSSGHFKLRK